VKYLPRDVERGEMNEGLGRKQSFRGGEGTSDSLALSEGLVPFREFFGHYVEGPHAWGCQEISLLFMGGAGE